MSELPPFPFATTTVALLAPLFTPLFSFKLVDILVPVTNCDGDGEEQEQTPLEIPLDHPLFEDNREMERVLEEARRLEEIGEALLTKYENGNGSNFPGEWVAKKVKEKKRKEIGAFLGFLQDGRLGGEGDVAILDVGCGVGHLCRALATLTTKKIYAMDRTPPPAGSLLPPGVTPLTHTITEEFPQQLPFLISQNSITIISLHACGDVVPIILRTFVQLEQVRELALISCCYHKITKKVFMSERFRECYSGELPLSFLRLASDKTKTCRGKSGDNDEEKQGASLWGRALAELRKEKNIILKGDDEQLFNVFKQKYYKKMSSLLTLHNSLSRLSTLTMLIDRLTFLQESGFSNSKIYSPVLPLSLTPHGDVLYCCRKMADL